MQSLKFLQYIKSKFPTCVRHFTHESFLTGTSARYIEELFNSWLKDPASVHPSWDVYFQSVGKSTQGYFSPPILSNKPSGVRTPVVTKPPGSRPMSSSTPNPVALDPKSIESHLAVSAVIRSYQARGHLLAKLDPLEIWQSDTQMSRTYMGSPPSEFLRKYKFENMDQVFTLTESTFIGGGEKKLPLKEIVKRLDHAYCRHIGLEYMYIDQHAERQFLREKMETPEILKLSPEQKKKLLRRLIWTSEFENFLSKKWNSEKRFGLEGLDMFIPGVKQIIDTSSELGVDHFFFGIAHRGRLNLLSNVFHKPVYQIFNQFVPLEPGDVGAGDVKYHYGCHTELTNSVTQKNFKLTMLANPSHLEVVCALVLGRARAEQVQKGDTEGKKNLAILIHGDAAFCGQGINYETLGLSYLPSYTTNGSITIILNNQVGFTTDPRFHRSSRYCSDLGRVVNAPVFHVNVDDPESVVHVCKVAAEYRGKFHKDIIIDLVGYRRHGHNEADEPMYTQPLMYTKIKKMKPVNKKYIDQLISENIVTKDEVKRIEEEVHKFFEDEYVKASQQTQVYIKDWIDTPWTGFYSGKDPLKKPATGVAMSILDHIGNKYSTPPPDNLEFALHKGIVRLLGLKNKLVQQKLADWSLGEAFAIGSLVKEGFPVRLSGEDVERGTFSHRHHVLHHQTKDKVRYEPLNDLWPDQAPYMVSNSSLSEYGVLGFEVGYAQANPNVLVIWEAQFGDFFNGAQIIFDQFLCCGESKWGRQNGIVVLLPHGFEGMGSEHSHARPERFLQNCDDDPNVIPDLTPDFAIKQLFNCNWIIANCSTPANMFHILRRQIHLAFRKPLIIFTPKSLLRLPECRSPFEDMMEGTEFRRLIPEKGEASKAPQNVKKLIFCTGKAYYDIAVARAKSKLEKEIAVARVEQISPFPFDLVKSECEKYSQAKIVWAQEEPKNYGAYHYVLARMTTLLKDRPVGYVGRPVAGSPATGLKKQHIREVAKLMEDYVAL